MELLINAQKEERSHFKKSNLFLLFVLSFITFGAYIGIWFLKNKNTMQNMSSKTTIHFGLWKWFTIVSFLFLFIHFFGEMVFSDYGMANIKSYEIIFSFFFVGLLYYSIFRLREFFEVTYAIELNKYLIFFLHIFYIQYKINETQ
ncbi:hypothetical protein [Solibacillus sp. CAU 1738]|uniref:hypothetical protein n=1 Tax=Solibacillus sp. CAU 1738 TaxID=3140363 RepID=UPI00326142FC